LDRVQYFLSPLLAFPAPAHRNRDVDDIGDENLGKVQEVSKVSEGTRSICLVDKTVFRLYDLGYILIVSYEQSLTNDPEGNKPVRIFKATGRLSDRDLS
jgi:hypothetical protein